MLKSQQQKVGVGGGWVGWYSYILLFNLSAEELCVKRWL